MTDRPWRTVLAIDADPKACEVYRANVHCDDVRCGSVADHIGALRPGMADVVLGGPPCQPYSSAGKQRGASDKRDCVPDFCAAVEAVRPRMFLMEQVSAFAVQRKFHDVYSRTIRRLEDAGYVVQARVLDAVNYGVPQFRRRAWVWGIRRDVYDGGVGHIWPAATHVWPHAPRGLFGNGLHPAVTVGMALGLDGYWDAQNNTTHGDKPMGTILGEAQSKGGKARQYALRRARGASVQRRDHPTEEPSPTITDGAGGSGGVLRMIQSHADPEKPIAVPSPTLRSGGDGHDGCRLQLHEYRWSDAMLAKHPPASTASPAPTVQAEWYKGGAEGLLSADGREWESRHPIGDTSEPSTTLRGRSLRDGGRCVEGVVRDGLLVRRLTVDECARLQSMPDDFVWPDSVAKTHRYRIIGNGWGSLMAWHMSRALRASDPVNTTVIDLFCGGGCGAVGWHGRYWAHEVKCAMGGGR